jgi:hypothetical protein
MIGGSVKDPYPNPSKNNPVAPAGSKNSFSFPSRARLGVSFLLILSLSIPQSFLFPANPLPSLRDFNGLSLNFFNEETGRRFLKISYQKAIAEKKKIGFLRMNLAFLKVNGLSIEMDSRHAESSKILELFQKVSQKRGVRYAVAEPIKLEIQTSESSIRVFGQKGKFTSDGSLRVWGDVKLVHGKVSEKLESISLTTDTSLNALVLTGGKTQKVLSVPLSKQP